MSVRSKLLRIGLAILGLIVLLGIAALVVVQTDWFRDFVRRKIITATEEGTGGRVEIGSFTFSPSRMEAVVTNFVIHGREPANAAPWIQVARAQVNLRLFTSLHRVVDISYLGVDRPQANIMVFPDGTTNIPQPAQRPKPASNTTPLDTVIDLAVDRFLVSQGTLVFNGAPQGIDVHANNLHALLQFNSATRSYKGTLSLQPIYVVAGRNTPVVFTVTLPVIVERTRIALENAQIATPQSAISISGSLDDLNNPKTNARISGQVALADVAKLANTPLDVSGRNLPSVIGINGNAAVAPDRITVDNLRLSAGASSIDASGTLKDPRGNGSLNFNAILALDELGRLAKLDARPSGTVRANGTASLDNANNYRVSGQVEGRDLAFSQGAQRYRNVSLHSNVTLDPQRLQLADLRLSALGGQLTGDGTLEQFARYHFAGNLHGFNLQTILAATGNKPLPYDANISGPIEASGDLKSANAKLAVASTRLGITPGRRGIPVSGRLQAQYNGETGAINVNDSFLSLPNTRLSLSGSLNNRLNLDLTSRNLNDLLAAAGPNPPAVKLEGGQARLNGYVTGGLSNPHLLAHLDVTQFSVEGRRFDSLALDADAAKSRAAVSNGSLRRGTMEASFNGAAGLRNWSPAPNQGLQATAAVRNGDLADIMALAGQPPAGYAGVLTADVRIAGTIGNPTGTAVLQASSGKLMDQPFDRIQASVNMADQLITIPTASLTAGPSQVNLSAEFQHPGDSMSTGQLHAHVQSNQIDLRQIQALQNMGGTVTLNADVRGSLAQSELLVNAVNADASARGLSLQGQTYGDATLHAVTGGNTVRYDLTSNFAGSNTKVAGTTQLTKDYPTTADATIRGLPIERVLAVARQTDIPAKGVLSGTAHVNGTLSNPQGSADLEIVNVMAYDEPLDRVHARASYLAQRVDVDLLEIAAGPSHVQLSAHYTHPAGKLDSGDLQFKIDSNRIDLARIRNLQKARPGLGGALQLAASGAGTVQAGTPRLLFRDLNADLSATNVSTGGKSYGDVTLKAATNAGRLNYTLDSNLAGSVINARGTAQLNGDYPLDTQLSFRNVAWSRLQPLLAPGGPPAFEATAEGQVNVSGPALKTDQLRGSLRIPSLEFDALARRGAAARNTTIRNQGPISATLDRGVIRIDSMHLTGPQTDINATGTVAITQTHRVSLNVKAGTDLGVLQELSSDFYSSGKVALNASVAGTLDNPAVTGTLELQKASINYVDVPNGLSNANGVIVFSGTTATIRTLTADSGGGKVALAGFVNYAGALRLGLRATVTGVRVRAQEGVSIVASASINVTGTSQASLASGTVTIDRLSYAPQSDFGSILTRAAPPVQTAGESDSMLDHMRLNIRVRTSSSTAVQASLAENLQVQGDLRVSGTAARPGILGRLTITRGDLVFFGSKYRVSQGAVSFFNPLRIEPVLDFSLETQAKGVNVVLNVTGPVDNMKLSYTSEPPLQFQEIVSLLASGKTPTSDPTLLANQPSQPTQSYQQMGESAIVGKALADPVASRLERVFGISQLKIDPAFTSGSDLPQARVTLQQQVATNITFTYITALNDPNSQIVRVEWALNQRWSAIANRDENGMFSINLFYKKQFR